MLISAEPVQTWEYSKPSTFNMNNGQVVWIYQESPPKNFNITEGSEKAPDEKFGSTVHVSRTLKIEESKFAVGDGADGLAAIAGVTEVEAGSQAQGIGVFGGGETNATFVGTRSHADGLGGYFVGSAKPGSTRSGQGIFTLGRREAEGADAVGTEVVCDNETTKAGVVGTEGPSDTRGMWIHCNGKANSAVGIQFGFTERAFEVGIMFNKSSTVKSSISTHPEAAPVILGATERIFGKETGGAQLLEVYTGTTAIDPGVVFGTTKGANFSMMPVHNSTGQMKIGVCNSESFGLTGTKEGYVWINFTPTKQLMIGAQTKGPMISIGQEELGFFGVTAVVRPHVGAAPAETLAGVTASLKAVREKLILLGLMQE